MATTQVIRTLDTTTDALWRCARAFGDLSWAPGDLKVEVRGEGVGQVRIIDRPHGKICEQLTSLDDDARSLTYIVPAGNPVPVTDYEARMTVSDDGGRAGSRGPAYSSPMASLRRRPPATSGGGIAP